MTWDESQASGSTITFAEWNTMVGDIKKYWPLSSAIDLNSFNSANWHNSSLIWSNTDKKWLAYKSGAGTGGLEHIKDDTDITGWSATAFANSGIMWNGSNWEAMPSGGAGASNYLKDNADDTTTGTLTAKSFSGPLSGTTISGGTIRTNLISGQGSQINWVQSDNLQIQSDDIEISTFGDKEYLQVSPTYGVYSETTSDITNTRYKQIDGRVNIGVGSGAYVYNVDDDLEDYTANYMLEVSGSIYGKSISGQTISGGTIQTNTIELLAPHQKIWTPNTSDLFISSGGDMWVYAGNHRSYFYSDSWISLPNDQTYGISAQAVLINYDNEKSPGAGKANLDVNGSIYGKSISSQTISGGTINSYNLYTTNEFYLKDDQNYGIKYLTTQPCVNIWTEVDGDFRLYNSGQIRISPATTTALNLNAGAIWASGSSSYSRLYCTTGGGIGNIDVYHKLLIEGEGSSEWTADGDNIYYADGEVRVGHSGFDCGDYKFQVSGDSFLSGQTTFKGDTISGLSVLHMTPSTTEPSDAAGTVWSSGNTTNCLLMMCTSNGSAQWHQIAFV